MLSTFRAHSNYNHMSHAKHPPSATHGLVHCWREFRNNTRVYLCAWGLVGSQATRVLTLLSEQEKNVFTTAFRKNSEQSGPC